MLFMNESEVYTAYERLDGHPVLGPATQTLVNLMEWANQNSDGWCYWPKPCRAAKSLQALIQAPVGVPWWDTDRPDATAAKLRAALSPVKAFRTRQNADFKIVEA